MVYSSCSSNSRRTRSCRSGGSTRTGGGNGTSKAAKHYLIIYICSALRNVNKQFLIGVGFPLQSYRKSVEEKKTFAFSKPMKT